jgi:hypothetical protein
MSNHSISLLTALCGSLAVAPCVAAELSADFVGVRVGTNAGDDVRSDLRRYDIVSQLKLPWRWQPKSNFNIASHLEITAGLLHNDDDASVIGSVGPGLKFSDGKQRFYGDISMGLALIPDYRLGPEDFGGPVQFTYGGGIGFRLHERLLLGYRAQHFSDAWVYGKDNRGVDMHMLEIRYRFGAR